MMKKRRRKRVSLRRGSNEDTKRWENLLNIVKKSVALCNLNNKKFLQSFPIGIKLDTYNINRASEVGIRQIERGIYTIQ